MLGPAGPCQVRAVRLVDEDSGALALAISPSAGKLLKLAAVEGTHEGWHYSLDVVRINAENLTEALGRRLTPSRSWLHKRSCCRHCAPPR